MGRRLTAAACLTILLSVTACENLDIGPAGPEEEIGSKGERYSLNDPGGTDLLSLFKGDSGNASATGGGIGVNSYLWRATLDTISFMPLSSADPFGGVIITDWYAPAQAPGERFKMNVYILGRELRADGIRVAVFRQNRSGGGWADASIGDETATNIENQILTRARQLRLAATSQQQQ